VLFGFGPEHERVAAVGEQVVNKRIGAFWRTTPVRQFFHGIAFAGDWPLTFLIAHNTGGTIALVFPAAVLRTIWSFVRRIVPGSTKDEAEDRGAHTQQIGIMPDESANKDRRRDRQDRPSRNGLREIG
jgi:hypothetical protein